MFKHARVFWITFFVFWIALFFYPIGGSTTSKKGDAVPTSTRVIYV